MLAANWVTTMQLQKLGLSAVITLLTAVSMPIYQAEVKGEIPTDTTLEKTSTSSLIKPVWEHDVTLAKQIEKMLKNPANNHSSDR